MTDQLAEALICPSGCGDLSWTVLEWHRMVHKHVCESRREPYCQTHPDSCDLARLSVPCETCGGDNVVGCWSGAKDHRRTDAGHAPCHAKPCPDCTDGWRVNPEAVEAMAIKLGVELNHTFASIHPMKPGPNTLRIAEAGLRAVIEWAGREEE